MIIVVGIFEVDGGDRKRFLETKRSQVASTLKEPGCIDYAFAADAGDARRVHLIERWACMADLEAHVDALRTGAPPPVPAVSARMTEMAVYEATPARAPWT
ncbi:MAG TPA: antibiotic biosynthesis monooxygenase [Acidimicrobiales bacterium]|nr:antibiotic biosynthesis monooxygenase [Acidimicrobiales bacterium]